MYYYGGLPVKGTRRKGHLQIEGNILTPILSKKFIGLPPVLVLIALLIGGQLWGIMGAILAIPLAGIFFEFVRDFFKKRKDRIVSEEAIA